MDQATITRVRQIAEDWAKLTEVLDLAQQLELNGNEIREKQNLLVAARADLQSVEQSRAAALQRHQAAIADAESALAAITAQVDGKRAELAEAEAARAAAVAAQQAAEQQAASIRAQNKSALEAALAAVA